MKLATIISREFDIPELGRVLVRGYFVANEAAGKPFRDTIELSDVGVHGFSEFSWQRIPGAVLDSLIAAAKELDPYDWEEYGEEADPWSRC